MSDLNPEFTPKRTPANAMNFYDFTHHFGGSIKDPIRSTAAF
jgi:hypothetical protein